MVGMDATTGMRRIEGISPRGRFAARSLESDVRLGEKECIILAGVSFFFPAAAFWRIVLGAAGAIVSGEWL